MSSTVEKIKERLSVADVLGSYLKLEKAGKNFKARCPFHNEKTPSFFISPDRESYYCFGCNAHGDIFTFVQEFEGVDFMGALKILADRAGVEIERSIPAEKNPHARLYEVLEKARLFYVMLYGQNEAPKKYVASRGITPETVEQFSVGYAPAEWRALYDHLSRMGYTETEMLAAGLVKRKDPSTGPGQAAQGQGSHPYDVFRSRIMFPVYDSSGRCVAFAGRYIGPEDEPSSAKASEDRHVPPKYLNSPETPIFKKSDTLYGFDKAKSHIRKNDFSILVEGQIDLVITHQAGYRNAIAVMGTAFTQTHAEKIRRFSNNLAIALDADDAGVASALRTSKIALAAGMDVKVAALPDGKDPADVITSSIETWRECVRGSVHVVDFLLARIGREEGDSRKLKQRIQKEAFPFIAAIPNRIDRAHFIERAARAMAVDESLVEEEVNKTAVDLPVEQSGAPQTAQVPSKHDRILRSLVGIMAWQAQGGDAELGTRIGVELERVTGRDPRGIYEESERSQLAFEAEVAYGASEHLDRYVDEMMLRLEEDVLKERLAAMMEKIAQSERSGSASPPLEILEEYKSIGKRLDELKRKSVS